MVAKMHARIGPLALCAILVSPGPSVAQPLTTGKSSSSGTASDVVPVRVGGAMQPGFSRTEICKNTQAGVRCEEAIVHVTTGRVISVGGHWLSGCRADGHPVSGVVPSSADIYCLIRPERERPPPKSRLGTPSPKKHRH